jgi:hypothetical protein
MTVDKNSSEIEITILVDGKFQNRHISRHDKIPSKLRTVVGRGVYEIIREALENDGQIEYGCNKPTEQKDEP